MATPININSNTISPLETLIIGEPNKEFCIFHCWDILKEEVIKVCGLDVYAFIFMISVLAISIIFRQILIKHGQCIEKKWFNALLLLQFILMVYSIIFIVLNIRIYIGWV